MDYTERIPLEQDYSEPAQDVSNYPALCPDVLNAQNYTFCPWAKTVTGLDPNSDRYVAIGVTCKRWGCPYCAIRKIRRLAWMSRNAEPNRLLTLTHSSKEWENGKTCWEASSKAFPELIRYIRKEHGPCEYLRVLELQENGMPHFHCMLRSGFLPHAQILAEWRRLCGAAGVNLKKIDDTFRTFRYLVKYLTKLHKIPWTDRHVSYSRGFFRPEDIEQIAYATLDQVVKYDTHPWVWLNERLAWEQVQTLGEGKWILPAAPPDKTRTIDPKSLGLPAAPDAAPPPPMKQRYAPGIEDAAASGENDSIDPHGKRKRTPSRKRKPAAPAWPPAPTPQPSPETPF